MRRIGCSSCPFTPRTFRSEGRGSAASVSGCRVPSSRVGSRCRPLRASDRSRLSMRTCTPIRGRCASAAAPPASWRARARVFERYAARGPCRAVYCLGYCDRSPAALLPNGRIALGDPSARSSAARRILRRCRAVRASAREPLVTARIARGDFSALEAARRDGAYAVLARALAPAAARRSSRRSSARASAVAAARAFSTGGQVARGGPRAPSRSGWWSPTETRAIPGSFVDRVAARSRPARRARGNGPVRLRDRRARGLRLRPLRVPARARADRAPRSPRRARPECSVRRCSGVARPFEVSVVSGRGQLRLRRGDGAAERARGPARRGAAATALSRRARLRAAARPSSTTSRRSPTSRSCSRMGAERYARLGTRGLLRHQGALAQRRLRAAGPRRGRVRDAAAQR